MCIIHTNTINVYMLCVYIYTYIYIYTVYVNTHHVYRGVDTRIPDDVTLCMMM